MNAFLPVALLACATTLSAATAPAPAAPPVPADEDRPVPIIFKAERAQAMYHVQGDRQPDRPVGDGFTLAGTRIAARLDDKGKLELDLAGDGTFKPARAGALTVTLGKPEDKHREKLDLFLAKDGDAWTYRVITQLTGQIGDERLAVIDVDGDGAFNTPGVDAVSLGGAAYAFPLPGPDERWCTAKLDLTGLAFGPAGESPKVVGRPIATTVGETLGELKAINLQRLKYGLTPRGENADLSAALQKHCHYMVGTGKLAHPEDPSTPGYSADGAQAGMSSILSVGSAPEHIAEMMVSTFYHRQDVVRPNTHAFGLGYEGRFGGIDGRRDLAGSPAWPVVVPPPDALEIPLRFSGESPDPIAGDREAGFPITVYFANGPVTIRQATLEMVDKTGVHAVDCYPMDAKQGGDVSFNGFQHVAGLIAKDPLVAATQYQASFVLDVAGTEWKRTWRFATIGLKPAK